MADDKKKKKKRRVGRPKKRGRKPLKKKSLKSKKISVNNSKKGFGTALTYNRVRKILWENYKQDFVSYKEFISSQYDENGNKIKGSSIASRVYAECKSQDCLEEDVLNIYIQLNQSKDDIPIIPAEYYDPHNYWKIITEDWSSGMPNNLWVVSPMLLANPDYFLGVLWENRYFADGEEIDKKEYEDFYKSNKDKKLKVIDGYKNRFQPFVDHCNQIQMQFPEYDNYVAYWKFTGKEDNPNQPYWNEQLKRWEIEIIICTGSGVRNNYDFEPNEEEFDVEISNLPTESKKDVSQEQEKADDDIKKIVDEATIELQKIQAQQELIKLEIERNKSEKEKIEAQEKADKRKTEELRERFQIIKNMLELGFTKEEINKLLGI
jgi:hypothetical protein